MTSPTVSTCKNRIPKPIKSESVDCFLRNLQLKPSESVRARGCVLVHAGGAELLKEAADPRNCSQIHVQMLLRSPLIQAHGSKVEKIAPVFFNPEAHCAY